MVIPCRRNRLKRNSAQGSALAGGEYADCEMGNSEAAGRKPPPAQNRRRQLESEQ